MGKSTGNLFKVKHLIFTGNFLAGARGAISLIGRAITTVFRSSLRVRKINSISRPKLFIAISFIAAGLYPILVVTASQPVREAGERMREQSLLKQLATLEPIDAHTHISAAAPQFSAMLDDLHIHVLDILYVDDTNRYRSSIEKQKADALKFIASSYGRGTLCTTFDPFQWNQAGFAQTAIDGLNRDFADGAVAAKVWKNIGMEIKDSPGKYLMPDDAILQPIYRDIAEHNKTLIIHAAAMDAAWQPPALDQHLSSYLTAHPEWQMWKKPDAPQKKDILDARDRLLGANPNLRVVGAHLGSMATQLDELGVRFERYPNCAVDVSSRVHQMSLLPRDKVRAFIIKYQDRILYGTDLSFSPQDDPQTAAQNWKKTYFLEWRYFSTEDAFSYWGNQVQGLGLPNSVLRKLYRENAIRWIPGIAGNAR
jgi:predicted TIM-barrel fold metal-dependent hydrolase